MGGLFVTRSHWVRSGQGVPGDGQSPGGHRQRACLGWPAGAKSGKLGRSFRQKGETRPGGFSLAATPPGRAARNAMPIITDFGPAVQDYLAHFESIAFPRPEQCPCCGASHTFIGHGFYPRQPKDQAQVYRILDQALVLQGLPYHALAAAQRRASGEPYISPPGGGVPHPARPARVPAGHHAGLRRAAARRAPRTPPSRRRGRREALRPRGARAGRGRDQAVRPALRQPRGAAGRELPPDAALHVARPARDLHQARATACTTSARSSTCPASGPSGSPSRRATSTRRSPTGWAWPASSASSRT